MKSSGLVLFACAGLLFSGGAILGGSAAWSLFRMSYYFWTSDLGVELSSTMLFIAGAMLCLPICWLSTLVPYYPRSTTLLTTLMSLLMASMFMVALGITSISGLSRAIREPAAVNASMMQAMTLDAFDPAVRSSFSAMQLELKCCGVNAHTDWYKHRAAFPLACCGRAAVEKRAESCFTPLYQVGCLRPALAQLRNYVNSLTALASAMVVCMAVTLFTAAYTLVTGVVDRGDARVFKPAQSVYTPFSMPAVLPHPANQI